MSFSIRRLRSADLPVATRLWRTEFGAPADTVQSWLSAAINPRFATAGFAAVPTDAHPANDDADGPALVGLGITEIGRRRYTREYLGLDVLDVDLDLHARNGIFHLCVVAPAWRRCGVATALYRHRLNDLAARGMQRIVGISWNRTHAPDSRALFDAYGFRRVATVRRFYARTTPRKRCPDCGGACLCTASIHVRDGGAPSSTPVASPDA